LLGAFQPTLNYSADPDHPNTLKIHDWIREQYPEYEHFFQSVSARVVLLALIAAADLKGVIASLVSPFQPSDVPAEWSEFRTDLPEGGVTATALVMVALGPRLSTTSTSRESMIKHLLELRIHADSGIGPLEREEAERLFGLGIPGSATKYPTLSWVLSKTPQKHISKAEAYFVATLLLESGANPNALAIPHESCPGDHSLLYDCIRHHDMEAVRLLLLHGADTSEIDHSLLFHLSRNATTQGDTTIDLMLTLLNEYGFR
jgi:hypothetical protein